MLFSRTNESPIMMRKHTLKSNLILAAFLTLGSSTVIAAEPNTARKLQFPMACTLGDDCWIARYSDRKKGQGKADYMCGPRTQNGHKGTDIAITDYGQMRAGVPVLATLDGTVLRLRKGVKDTPVTKDNHEAIKKTGCGNAVILGHPDGYQTAYCHMKENSINIQVGDTVVAGQQIGSVGLSGLTEYPHLHFDVRKNGKRIDPFDGTLTGSSCGVGSENNLWEVLPPYETMSLMPLVFSDELLTRQSRWQVQPSQISKNAPALVLTGRAWNLREGDHWLFHIIRPDGVNATERSMTIDKNRQSNWYGNKLPRPKGGFMTGTWKGKLMVLRQHEDGTVTRYESETEVLVTP